MSPNSRSLGDIPGLTPEQEATWFAYMRVVLRLDFEVAHDLAARGGLSHADFHVLNALADSPGEHLPVGDLAVRIGWERSRLSHQVLRMERRGLVSRRTAATDARVTEVGLSSAGRDALRLATPGHAALVRRLFFDGLDPDLLDPLRTALDQIHEQLVAEGTLPRPPGHQTQWAG
ncbi:MarR family winged helix-turn-helix transcriptional regulator [Cellulomonas sp. ICMP 17802]|uniref:MarR family winged helix-turn-helix transcriptional regulator n=1 Tax=Cellulomonas sp. ICMP 17802 TaxID=3239199 RepID=UPI00351BE7FE